MIDAKMISKLERTVGHNSISKLQDISVFEDKDGSYNLFNKYTITKIKLMYEVTGPSIPDKLEFFTLKNAVAWCSFDKRIRVSDCKRIVQLDRNLAGIDTMIQQHQRLINSSKNVETELIYIAKLGEEKLKRKLMTEELEGYIQESKNWQLRRFKAKA